MSGRSRTGRAPEPGPARKSAGAKALPPDPAKTEPGRVRHSSPGLRTPSNGLLYNTTVLHKDVPDFRHCNKTFGTATRMDRPKGGRVQHI